MNAAATGAAPLDIAVSIVSHAHAELVFELLQQLAALERGPRRVIVTFNLQEADWPQRLQGITWPFELLVQANPEPKGFGANHNAAFVLDGRQQPAALFSIMNPDIRLLGNPFPALWAAVAGDARVGAAYPDQLDTRGRRQDHERLLPTPWRLLRRALGRPHEVVAGARPDWVNAAFLCLRREAFDALHGFDESYRMYCEDVDLCLRLQLAGWRLARVPVAIEHRAARASHGHLRHLYWHVASLLRLWRSAPYRHYRRVAGVKRAA